MADSTYIYTVVTRAKALESTVFGTTFSTNAYQLIAKFLFLRNIAASKKDLINGDRVYRMHRNAAKRLELDKLDRRFIPTRLGDFIFDKTSDPTAGRATVDNIWLPVGL